MVPPVNKVLGKNIDSNSDHSNLHLPTLFPESLYLDLHLQPLICKIKAHLNENKINYKWGSRFILCLDSNFQSFQPKNKSRFLMYQCKNTNTNMDRF